MASASSDLAAVSTMTTRSSGVAVRTSTMVRERSPGGWAGGGPRATQTPCRRRGIRCAAMQYAARPAVSLALVLTCAVGTMLLGTALKSPCAEGSWADGRQYELLCYSDIVPLLGTEQLGTGRLPFLQPCVEVSGQNCDEYPVLTMYFMRTAGWFSGDSYAGFYYVNAALLLACAVVTAVCLYVMVRGRALYFALAPTLLIYGTVNWDLFAVALSTAALLAFFRRRDGWAGVLLGLGAAAKFYPAMLVVPLIAHRLRDREPDRAITLGWTITGTWLAVNLPFAIASPSGWFEFFRFNSARLADFDSLWYIACRRFGICFQVGTINPASAALFVAAFSRGVGDQGPARPRLLAVDPRDAARDPVPADEQGVLAAVRALAAPLVRARAPRPARRSSRSRSRMRRSS